MEQQRPLLFIALAIVLFLLWDAWQRDFGPEPTSQSREQTEQSGDREPDRSDVPMGADSASRSDQSPEASDVPASGNERGTVLESEQRIEVVTDVFRAEIDTVGGDLRKVELLEYPVESDKPDEPVVLMNDKLPNLFVSQSGFTAKREREGDDSLLEAPNHYSRYQADATRYRLREGNDSLSVDLVWESSEGVEFIKTYRFSRGDYLIDVEHTVNNPTDRLWRGNLYTQLQRTQVSEIDTPQFVYTYMGGVIYSPEEKYEKIDFSDMQDDDLERKITGGWAAMIQHYFVGAWIPPAEKQQTFYSRYIENDTRYVLGMKSADELRVGGGEQQTLSNRLFVGPKLQERLAEVAPGLDLTVDYGLLHFISKPLFWILDFIHDFVGNWGWSIVLLTILIKLVFYKLSETSYKSMANMRRVQPRMKQLKERHAGDRQKMNQALMDLYKKEKINPLGGCLPILVQIPVFIALYWVLLESVEMRQAPWILWIQNMSAPDPYFILPLLMGVTMFVQQKLNPAPLDPIQAKIMMFLPFVFTIFFAFFPAGLVLYWVVNNLLSIAQQYYITRYVVKA
ncbi:membrane protein insertase YidC [Thiohalophilus thiocyanatoxydans]|uniref:Membrane protein insertase YidC n=1 Tax=Thiohalophilus thiocyanatoxydans TaxID=381308 RepID=A0A4R8IWJ5_9GAMM|nr:membrane protein insertase YidC [Thiohalophilus thiocyanatoxydans]TDY03870.1 protein translocase subunit yidC [Thiohalophilus thiocyanatoxydans]